MAALRDIRAGRGNAIPRTERDLPIHLVAAISLALAVPMGALFVWFLPSMTTGLRTYTLSAPSATLTRLTLGTTFHYRVRAINRVVKGTWTTPTKFRMASSPTNVVVLTYNLCGQDKCVNSSNGMKRWTTRRTYAGRIARSSAAGVIATQESHDEDTRFGTQLPGYALGAYYSAKSLFYDTAKYEKLRSGVYRGERLGLAP